MASSSTSSQQEEKPQQSIQDRIDALPRDCIPCDTCEWTNDNHNGTEQRKLMRCSQCHLAYYCSIECQKKSWKTHKADCRKGKELRERRGLSLDVSTPQDINLAPKNDECPICLQDLSDSSSPTGNATSSSQNSTVVLQACQHQFCFCCLRDWQQFNPNSPCPMCRSEIIEKDVQQAAIQRALLLAGRANQLEARNLATSQQEVEELRQEAIDEMDQCLKGAEDKPHIQVLITKAEILSQSDRHDPQEALDLFNKVIELDNERHARIKLVNTMLARFDAATAAGVVDEEAQRCLDEFEKEMEEKGMCNVVETRLEGDGPARQTQIRLFIAQLYEKLEEWNKAKETYQNLLSLPDFYPVATGPQQRAVFLGLARCGYHLERYDKAITASHAAIECARHYPDVHKYIALSQKAEGDLQEAVNTMNRAALYETPWDDDHRESVLNLYEELKAELEARE